MKSEEALAAEQAVEAKLAESGADQLRRRGPAAAEAVVETPEAPAEAIAEPPEPAAAEELPPAEPVAVEVAPEGDDPAVQALLAKYDGDVNKALQAAVQLQRKLGEQGNELGQERQKAAEYEQVISELAELREQIAQPAATPTHVDQATVDWFDEQIFTNPTGALEWARQQNNELLVRRGIDLWKDTDPFAAAVYVNNVQNQELEQRLQAQRPTNDSVEIQSALNQVLADHREFVQYADDLPTTIERYPNVAAGLSGNQQAKQQAIETLFALAERDTLRALALSGAAPASTTTHQEVVAPQTSGDRPEEEAKPPSNVDVFREQFRQEAGRYGGERPIPGAFVAH